MSARSIRAYRRWRAGGVAHVISRPALMCLVPMLSLKELENPQSPEVRT